MTVQRFLGCEWASVHGSADPQQLWVQVLEAGFDGLVAAPAPRPMDWGQLIAAAADLPVHVGAVRATSVLDPAIATAGLAMSRSGPREVAMAAVRRAADTARTVGCPAIVLEPGLVPVLGEIESDDLGDPSYRWTRERADALLARRSVGRDEALDQACRAIHAVVRACPELSFGLATGRNLRVVADRQGLADIFEDLHQLPLGYWHDAGAVARREQIFGEPQGEWLEAFGNRLKGMSLGDSSPDGMLLPPGAGGVDYGLLATYVPRDRTFPVGLDLDPTVAASDFAGMRSCLDKFGL